MSILPLWVNRAQSHWGNFQKLCETHARTFPPEETEEGWIIHAPSSTLLPAMVESRSRSLNFSTLAVQRRGEIGMLPGKAVLTLEIFWGAGSLGRMCSPFTQSPGSELLLPLFCIASLHVEPFFSHSPQPPKPVCAPRLCNTLPSQRNADFIKGSG